MKEEHGDEVLTFSINKGEIEAFLENRKLKLVDYLDNKEIEQRFLTNDDGNLIGPMTGHFRFVLASLKHRMATNPGQV